MYDVVAIGSATQDNFFEVDYELIDWPKTPLKKAMLLPFGEKLGVKNAYLTIGGNSANASVTFARQGFKTACAARIGDDFLGKNLKKQLQEEGVDTSHITVSRERHTAYSVLLLQGGERTILAYHGASDTYSFHELSPEKLKAKWWYVSLAGESDKMYLPIIEFARENKIKIAVNPSGHHIRHRGDEIRKSLKYVDVLALNSGEAAELVGISFDKEKEVFAKLDELVSPGIVVVTDGVNGSKISDGERIYKAGIFEEKKVVDRTGAGDAFGSGFVAGLLRRSFLRKASSSPTEKFDEEDIKYAIRLASANATSVVEHIGGTPGILRREEFDGDPRWKEFAIEVIRCV